MSDITEEQLMIYAQQLRETYRADREKEAKLAEAYLELRRLVSASAVNAAQERQKNRQWEATTLELIRQLIESILQNGSSETRQALWQYLESITG